MPYASRISASHPRETARLVGRGCGAERTGEVRDACCSTGPLLVKTGKRRFRRWCASGLKHMCLALPGCAVWVKH